MYQEKLAVAIKNNGKVLREFKDTVYIPFGAEYSLFIKNLNIVRACVNIEIDGTSATPGGLVVEANSSVDLERFIKDLDKGNRFKFIERTAGVENHRGVKAEDGLIRIEFEFEPRWQINSLPHHTYPYTNYPAYPWFPYTVCSNGTTFTASASGGVQVSTGDVGPAGPRGAVHSVLRSADVEVNTAAQGVTANINGVGITVPGSVSDQKFRETYFRGDGEKHVMVLKLLGETETGKVSKPVTVKTKIVCGSCGHKNSASTKFCSECGTGLILC